MKTISTSACPHDCPSTCVLDIEHDNKSIFKVRGNKENSYTKGVICAKVSRYRERTHHKNRLTTPMKRVGKKGNGDFKGITWDEALDIVCNNLSKTKDKFGSEAIWPYFYAGTMGLIQRDGINRLRHEFEYSGQYSTICNTLAQTGYVAGTGSLWGPDPREVIYSDVIIIWGGNPASTQVTFMKHVQNARKKNNAFLIVVDPYLTKTARLADLHIKLRPGTDGALACGIMKNLFKKNTIDNEYMKKFSTGHEILKEHLNKKEKDWASNISGVENKIIEYVANLISKTKKVYFRLGYGFSRQRNGSFNMHAVTSISTVIGSWKVLGGGAFYNNGGIYNINKSLIEGNQYENKNIRMLDQSRIGPILTGNKDALNNKEDVKTLFIQNTNPLVVAPDSLLVRKGFSREDLFVCVHEQFLTETAKYADILLPATSFVEHNDIYIAGGHQHLTYGPKLINSIGESKSNHTLINEISKRLGSKKENFNMTEEEIINETLILSNLGTLKKLKEKKFIDLQPDFQTSHFIKGFGHSDKKYHFNPKWNTKNTKFNDNHNLPDHYDFNEKATNVCPYKLVTAPAHNFLNSSFTETSSSIRLENKPKIKIHSNDMLKLKIKDNEIVEIGNHRAKLKIHVEKFDDLLEGVTVVEGIWPNECFIEGNGINFLVGSDSPEPSGGAVFHDVAIWIKKLPITS